MQRIEYGVTRSANASVTSQSHMILPLPNVQGILPQNFQPDAQWFPATLRNLDSGRAGNITSLIIFYNLQVLPGADHEPINSARIRTIKNHLGIVR